jgi:uncharacterized membrane protein YfhO
MSDTIDAVKHITNFEDSPFFRMEATFHRTVNDPIGTGYSGISHSSSVMNAPALTMLKQLGYAYGGHYTKYSGSTYITDSIFGIKYLMDKEDKASEYTTEGGNRFSDNRNSTVPEDYKLATHIEESSATYKFYKNPYALGLGVVCGENINSIELSDVNPFENQNVMYSALGSQDEVVEYFTRIMPKDSERLNLSTANIADDEGHVKYYPTDTSSGEAHIDYIVEMDKDSDLYLYLPTKYERSCNVWVLDEEDYQNGDGSMNYAGQFFVGDNYSILNLGSYLQNEEVRVRITIDNSDNEAYWSDVLFYSFDHDRFVEDSAAIQEKSLTLETFDNTSLTGTCYADSKGEYLFTTIPYEEGWEIKVNGKTVQVETCADALITIPLEQGENEISMEFKPSYYTGSLIISLAGFLIIVIIFIFEYKNGKIITAIVSKTEKKAKSEK